MFISLARTFYFTFRRCFTVIFVMKSLFILNTYFVISNSNLLHAVIIIVIMNRSINISLKLRFRICFLNVRRFEII